jgi:hypothetical protein
MRGKIIFAVGLATGYVLGTRAGRERYEQIKAGADKVWNTPAVQSGVQKVQEFAGQRVDVAKGKLADKARDALGALIGKKPLTQPSQSSSARTTTPSTTPTAATSAARTAAAKPVTPKKPAAKTPAATPAAPQTPAATTDSDE